MPAAEWAGYVIDMSNICWDRSIRCPDPSGPNLARFDQVYRAIVTDQPDANIYVVADNSLRHTLVNTTRRQWREYRAALSIKEVPVADELILEIASQDSSVAVVSRDQFMDHRKEHPWIAQQSERFLKPTLRHGTLELVSSGIRFESHQAVSRMIEAKEFQRLGIDFNDHREILESHWRSVNSVCLQSTLWDMLLLWPAVDDAGRARCPTCGEYLSPIGPRSVARQFIVFDVASTQEVLRFPIEQGAPVIIGRGLLRNGISLDAHCTPEVDTRRISRQHLLVEFGDSNTVYVTDLGSSNGTTIRRPGVPMREKLQPHSAVRFGQHDSIELSSTLRIELSGQIFTSTMVPLVPVDTGAGETIIDRPLPRKTP